MNWRKLLKVLFKVLSKDIPFLTRSRTVRSKSWAPRYFRKGRHWKDLQAVTRVLHGLVETNAPLVGGLQAAAQDAPRYPLWRVLTGLEQDLAMGTSLSESVQRNPRFFPGYYADLIRVGEESGTLAKSLTVSQDILREGAARRARMWQYALYIGITWLFLVTIFTFLVIQVMPVFVDMLKDFKMTPPAEVMVLTDFVDFLAYRWWLVLAALALIGILLVALKKLRFLRWLLLHVPGITGMVRKRALAHIAFALEKFLAAGVPLDDALDATAALDVHPLFAGALCRVRDRVRGGAGFRAALDTERCFPESFRGFVSLGENSGLLPEALARVGSLYRRQVAKYDRILLDLLSPIGVLVAGAGVLWLFSSYLESINALAAALVNSR